MPDSDGATRLLLLLGQVSLTGALLAGTVGAVCRLLRLSPRACALLWWGVLLKFVLDFLLPAIWGERAIAISLTLPLPMGWTSAAGGTPVAPTLWDRVPALLLLLWGIGSAAFAAVLVGRGIAASRSIRTNSLPLPEPLAALVTEEVRVLSARMGLSAATVPEVRLSPVPDSGPQVVFALPRPIILLPASLLAPAAQALSAEERQAVLAHEVAHVRRGDLWMGAIPALAECLFFFHPLVRWVRREWEAAREEACDTLALQALGGSEESTARYGALLLRLGGGPAPRANVASLGMVASPFQGLRRRLTHLAHWQSEGAHRAGWRGNALRVLCVLFAAAIVFPLRWEFAAPIAPVVEKETATPARVAIVPAPKREVQRVPRVSRPVKRQVASIRRGLSGASRRLVTAPQHRTMIAVVPAPALRTAHRASTAPPVHPRSTPVLSAVVASAPLPHFNSVASPTLSGDNAPLPIAAPTVSGTTSAPSAFVPPAPAGAPSIASTPAPPVVLNGSSPTRPASGALTLPYGVRVPRAVIGETGSRTPHTSRTVVEETPLLSNPLPLPDPSPSPELPLREPVLPRPPSR